MFSILLRHAGVVALLTMMLGLTHQPLSAQRRFDTEYAKSSEPNIVNLNKNLYTILGDHGSLFDRNCHADAYRSGAWRRCLDGEFMVVGISLVAEGGWAPVARQQK